MLSGHFYLRICSFPFIYCKSLSFLSFANSISPFDWHFWVKLWAKCNWLNLQIIDNAENKTENRLEKNYHVDFFPQPATKTKEREVRTSMWIVSVCNSCYSDFQAGFCSLALFLELSLQHPTHRPLLSLLLWLSLSLFLNGCLIHKIRILFLNCNCCCLTPCSTTHTNTPTHILIVLYLLVFISLVPAFLLRMQNNVQKESETF